MWQFSLLKVSCNRKDWSEEGMEYHGPFCVFCHQVPLPFSSRLIFPRLLFAADLLVETLLFALHILQQNQLQMGLSLNVTDDFR